MIHPSKPAICIMVRVFTHDPGLVIKAKVESCQSLKIWYLMPPWLTLRFIRYLLREQSREREAHTPRPQSRSCWKRHLGSPSPTVGQLTPLKGSARLPHQWCYWLGGLISFQKYIYIYIYIYVLVLVCVCVCVCVCVWVHKCVWNVRAYIRVCVNVYVCVYSESAYIYIYIYMCVCVCVCVNIYIYIYSEVRTYIYEHSVLRAYIN